MDALSSSLDSLSTIISHQQEEEDDGWVLVKKQKITILIPPPSPPSQQTVKDMMTKPSKQPRAVKRNSIAEKKRHPRLPRSRHKKTASVLAEQKADHTSGGQILRAELGDKPHIDVSDNLVGKPELEFSFHAYGNGNIGAANVVNRRIKAINLEKKLQGLGGLRRWLSLLRLDRFASVFERRKLSSYQLVNLTMSKLKDMGMNAVGPRRKLIHAIDLLCQPYYCQGI